MDSRTADDGAAIRRRRACPSCGRRFTTQETVILMVGKRSGATEPFTRDKIVNGVRRACQGRPVTEDQLAILAQQVEDEMRSRGCAEVSSHEVGLAILRPLQELDEVAYMRFAAVYRGSSHSLTSRKRLWRCVRHVTVPDTSRRVTGTVIDSRPGTLLALAQTG